MAVDARIPLGFDTSTIYDPVEAEGKQLALQRGRQQIQQGQFEQEMQPFKRQEAMDAQKLNALKVARTQTDEALRMLGMAQSPSQWGSVRQSILESGLAKPEEVPEMFDPRWLHSARMAHMDFKEQLDNEFRNSQLALQREDLGIRRAERKEDQDLKRRYYDILERTALNKSGEMIDPVTGEIVANPNASIGKPLPSDGRKQILTNIDGYKKVERALSLLEGKKVGGAQGDPKATGWKGYLPDAALQRIDPEGVDTRAAIADIGSAIIHDRSGAAVTAAEYPRLKPFIPKANDDPATVKKKLEKFRDEYERVIEDTSEFYRELGYNVPRVGTGGKGGAPDAGADLPKSTPSMSDEDLLKALGLGG